MRRTSLLALLVAALLGACAGAPPVAEQSPLTRCSPTRASGRRPRRSRPTGSSRSATQCGATCGNDIAHAAAHEGTQKGLIEALYQKSQLKLEYDARMTKTAAEAFATRSGNCLSLVIMTAALGKELRLPVYFQSAILDETWSRTGSLLFASGHVNMTLGQRRPRRRTQPRPEVDDDRLPAAGRNARHAHARHRRGDRRRDVREQPRRRGAGRRPHRRRLRVDPRGAAPRPVVHERVQHARRGLSAARRRRFGGPRVRARARQRAGQHARAREHGRDARAPGTQRRRAPGEGAPPREDRSDAAVPLLQPRHGGDEAATTTAAHATTSRARWPAPTTTTSSTSGSASPTGSSATSMPPAST